MDMPKYEKITAPELARKIFASFSYTKELPEEQVNNLIIEGIGLGNRLAQEIKARYPGLVPSQIASKCGVKVLYDDSEKNNPRYVKFAEYHVKKNEIHLNGNVIRFLDKLLQTDDTAEIIIAHELFHYYEMAEFGLISKKYSFKRKIFGFLEIIQSLLPMSEIAASSFSKVLAGISFEPKILEKMYFDNITAEAPTVPKKKGLLR